MLVLWNWLGLTIQLQDQPILKLTLKTDDDWRAELPSVLLRFPFVDVLLDEGRSFFVCFVTSPMYFHKALAIFCGFLLTLWYFNDYLFSARWAAYLALPMPYVLSIAVEIEESLLICLLMFAPLWFFFTLSPASLFKSWIQELSLYPTEVGSCTVLLCPRREFLLWTCLAELRGTLLLLTVCADWCLGEFIF